MILNQTQRRVFNMILLNDIESGKHRDSGAYYSTIISNVFEAIEARHPRHMVKQLAEIFTIQTAICGQMSRPAVNAKRRVPVNLKILVPKPGLPVRFKGVKFLRLDNTMPPILLGHHF